MKTITRLVLLLYLGLLFALLPLFSVHADDTRPTALREVGFDQLLNAQVPLDVTLNDETGQAVQLSHYFGEKPVVLAFVYYDCPMLCPLVLDGLVRSFRPLSFTAGDQFTVVVVSFNPNDTPALAATKKASLLQRYARPGAEAGWHFLTGTEAAVTQLAHAVGFRYTYDATQQQYAHAGGIVVLTPQGKIARYFYGIDYAPRDLRFGLIEAAAHKIGSPIDQLLLFCYHYDPATGKYTTAVMNTVRAGGVTTLVVLGTFLYAMSRRETIKNAKLKMKN